MWCEWLTARKLLTADAQRRGHVVGCGYGPRIAGCACPRERRDRTDEAACGCREYQHIEGCVRVGRTDNRGKDRSGVARRRIVHGRRHQMTRVECAGALRDTGNRTTENPFPLWIDICACMRNSSRSPCVEQCRALAGTPPGGGRRVLVQADAVVTAGGTPRAGGRYRRLPWRPRWIPWATDSCPVSVPSHTLQLAHIQRRGPTEGGVADGWCGTRAG